MLGPYRDILSKPGALAFSAAGTLARLPMSMVGIGIVLLISDERLYDSYGLAGQVSAVFIVAQAIASPQVSKLVDRYGQARIMRPAIAISMVSLLGLALVASVQGPIWLVMVLAVLVGLTMGNLGSLVRTRWNTVVATPRELQTAYSLESVLDEVCFVVGPVLATMLAASVHPVAGIAVAVFAALVGGYAFLAQTASEPAPSGRSDTREGRSSLLRIRSMLVLIVVFVCMGAIFGANDVATVAYAEEAGQKSMAGPILAVFAAGSLLGGLLYGTRNWQASLWRRFAIGIAAMGIGVSLFFWTSSLAMLAGVMFVVGFAIAPTLISGNALVQEIVPPSRLTEGLTWIGTALGVGVAAGSAIAGPLIDSYGGKTGFLVATGAGVLAVIAVLIGLLLRRRRLSLAARQVAEVMS